MEDLVKKPILFNYWKHHLRYLLDEIKTGAKSQNREFIRFQMKKIGNSTTDLYTGAMRIEEISKYCISQLKKIDCFRKQTYLKWLQQHPEEYQLMDFPDTSIWVLKIGIEKGRHIHIHPGRNVPHTLRAKANILKTAYLANLYGLKEKISPFDITLINNLREDILGLSPIKFVTMNQDLGKMIFLFGQHLGTVS